MRFEGRTPRVRTTRQKQAADAFALLRAVLCYCALAIVVLVTAFIFTAFAFAIFQAV